MTLGAGQSSPPRRNLPGSSRAAWGPTAPGAPPVEGRFGRERRERTTQPGKARPPTVAAPLSAGSVDGGLMPLQCPPQVCRTCSALGTRGCTAQSQACRTRRGRRGHSSLRTRGCRTCSEPRQQPTTCPFRAGARRSLRDRPRVHRGCATSSTLWSPGPTPSSEAPPLVCTRPTAQGLCRTATAAASLAVPVRGAGAGVAGGFCRASSRGRSPGGCSGRPRLHGAQSRVTGHQSRSPGGCWGRPRPCGGTCRVALCNHRKWREARRKSGIPKTEICWMVRHVALAHNGGRRAEASHKSRVAWPKPWSPGIYWGLPRHPGVVQQAALCSSMGSQGWGSHKSGLGAVTSLKLQYKEVGPTLALLKPFPTGRGRARVGPRSASRGQCWELAPGTPRRTRSRPALVLPPPRPRRALWNRPCPPLASATAPRHSSSTPMTMHPLPAPRNHPRPPSPARATPWHTPSPPAAAAPPPRALPSSPPPFPSPKAAVQPLVAFPRCTMQGKRPDQSADRRGGVHTV